MKEFLLLGYGVFVVVESILTCLRSVTAADFMWYVCRVFGIPLSLKTALVIRALLLATGGWALISNFGDIINIVFMR